MYSVALQATTADEVPAAADSGVSTLQSHLRACVRVVAAVSSLLDPKQGLPILLLRTPRRRLASSQLRM